MKTTFRGLVPANFSETTVSGTGTTSAEVEIDRAMPAIMPMICVIIRFIFYSFSSWVLVVIYVAVLNMPA
jgi:hypothetical protein